MTLRSRHFWLFILLLFLIAAAHTLRLRGLEMNPDEVWSIWQTFGTPSQIIEWTPYDWTPFYYLTLGGWRLIVGLHPIVLRLLSVLLSLLGATFTYSAGRRLAGRAAGLLAMLAYAAIAYSIFLSGYVRPYALAHALVPLSFWLTLRYFDAERRVWLHGLLLSAALVVSFYTTLVAPIPIFFFALFTLLVYGIRRSLRLWIPVGLAFVVLTLPITLPRVTLVTNRISALAPPSSFIEAMVSMFNEYAGDVILIWAALLAVGIVGSVRLLMQRRHAAADPADAVTANGKLGASLLGLALWGFGGLVAMYVAHPILGFFNPSYSFWTLTGIALFGGLALAVLPRVPRLAVGVIVLALMFVPPPERITRNYASPGASIFSWLQEPGHVRGGDVVVLDPHFDCFPPYEMDYFVRAFFPDGLTFVAASDGHRRVWYASNVNTRDAATLAAVSSDRAAGLSIGSANCQWQLYEAPPNVEGVLFENGMRFHGVEWLDMENGAPLSNPLVLREGEAFRVRLWWSVDEAPAADYSVGVHVLNNSGVLIAQTDSAPQVREVDPAAPPETSQWQPGRYYIEERTIQLPQPLSADTMRLVLTVYQWWDGVRITAPGVDDMTLLPLLPIHVKAW